MMNLVPTPTRITGSLPISNGSGSTAAKTKICNKFNTAEGCKFGDKCHFAHGEWELGKPIAASQEDPRAVGPIPGRFGGRVDPPMPAGSFGASATAKISVDASLASAIIGRGGVNSKQICRQTGAKLAIRDHVTDPNLRNIELEGTFEQIKEASAMVRDLISSIGFAGGPAKPPGGSAKAIGGPAPRSNYKTKICENFSNGSCTFGDRCHFAHGEAELRQLGA